MKYGYLGRTGVKVSKFCLGTMNFGGRTDEKEAGRILDLALEKGINFIDTANVYGHTPTKFPENAGRSEKIIGNYLTEHEKRDKVILATKMFFGMDDDINATGSAQYNILREIDASLDRLQTTRVDLYQVHSPSNNIPIDEILRGLTRVVQQRKTIYIGSSSFAAWQLVEALWAAKEHGLNRFCSEQCAYNLLDRRAERELFGMAETYGLGILTWSPLAGGFLTGKYRKNEEQGNQRYGSNAFWGKLEKMFQDQAFDIVAQLNELATDKGVTLDQMTLNWTVSQKAVTSVIIGPRTAEQLESNMGALEVELTNDDLKRIDDICRPFEMVIPFYGPNVRNSFGFLRWGPHQHRWN